MLKYVLLFVVCVGLTLALLSSTSYGQRCWGGLQPCDYVIDASEGCVTLHSYPNFIVPPEGSAPPIGGWAGHPTPVDGNPNCGTIMYWGYFPTFNPCGVLGDPNCTI